MIGDELEEGMIIKFESGELFKITAVWHTNCTLVDMVAIKRHPVCVDYYEKFFSIPVMNYTIVTTQVMRKMKLEKIHGSSL